MVRMWPAAIVQYQEFMERRTTDNILMKNRNCEQTSMGLAHTRPNNLILRPMPSIPSLAVGEGLGTFTIRVTSEIEIR